jgi:aconitase B
MARIPVNPPIGCGNLDDQLEEPYRYEEEIEDSILRAIDAEVDNLNNLKRAAVRLIYLREEPGKAVFRSGRMSVEHAYMLCNQAEIEMIPKLRAKGVVLGGI